HGRASLNESLRPHGWRRARSLRSEAGAGLGLLLVIGFSLADAQALVDGTQQEWGSRFPVAPTPLRLGNDHNDSAQDTQLLFQCRPRSRGSSLFRLSILT